MATPSSSRQDALARLIRDVATSETLCGAKTYRGITLDQLNAYLAKHGAITNPLFREQSLFVLDEGYYTPCRMAVYGNVEVAPEITYRLAHWAEKSIGG